MRKVFDIVCFLRSQGKVVVLLVSVVIFTCSNHDRSNPVDPQGTNWNPPTVSVMQDTSVAIKDSFYVHAQGASKTKAISEYIWEIPEDSTKRTFVRDTTTDNKIKIAFSSQGKYWVKVWAMDENGVLSGWEKIGGSGDTALQYVNGPGYIGVTVHQYAPTVVVMKDTNVAINDSFYVHATGSDTNGTVKKYLWSVDGINYKDSTDSGLVKVAFTTAGKKTVWAKTLDNDGLISAADSVSITVHLYAPWVKPMMDTIVSVNDSFYVHADGWDTNGTVVKYVWAMDSLIFSDTTTVGRIKVIEDTVGIKTVKLLVIDDDGIPSNPASFKIIVKNKQPAYILPAKGSSVKTSQPTLHWSPGTYCDSFRVFLDTNSVCSNVIATIIKDTFCMPTTPLIYNKMYYWQIIGIDGKGRQAAGDLWYFTTIPPPPGIPSLMSPLDSGKDVATNAVLTWDTVPMATSYRVQVSYFKNFAPWLIDDSVTSGNILIHLPAKSTTYYWRVNAKNTGGTSNWSTVWSFTTIPPPPSAPTLVSPGNGGKIILEPGVGYSLSWNDVAGVQTYHIQCSVGKSFTKGKYIDSVFFDYEGTWAYQEKTHRVTMNNSPPLNGTCYWRVYAINAGGTSDWSSVWSFTY